MGSLLGQQPGTQSGTQTSNPLQDTMTPNRTNGSQIPATNGANLQNQLQPDSTGANARTMDAYSSRNLNRLPPDPPTEFQRMVQHSTTQMLPIYGARLFRNAPTTFAPLDRVPVTPNYVIGPGDELLIQVWGQVTLNSRFTVDRAGGIYIPQVGTVHVAGVAFADLQTYLKSQMAKVFRNFDLNVNMGQLRSIQIFVVGQARRPGSYTVSSLSTLVDALFVTGGPTPQGSMRHIQLKRAGAVIVDFDLYDLLERGDKSKDAQLLPGDVLYIPPVGPQVAVAGSVNVPAIYELKSVPSPTVSDALDLAAGMTNLASETTLRLERVEAHRMRNVSDIPLDAAGRATELHDGDILELSAIVDRYRDGVTLRGNVANPGHYGWKPGMRVGDLFPDKDALITRDYWLRRGRLGEPTLQYLPYCPTNSAPRPATQSNSTSNTTTSAPPTNPMENDGLGAPVNPALNQNGTPNSLTYTVPSAAANAMLEAYGDANNCIPVTIASSNVDEQGFGQGYSQGFSQGYAQAASQGTQTGTQGTNRTGTAQDSTASNQPTGPGGTRGSTATATAGQPSINFPQRNTVALSAPDIDWSYAVIERQGKENLTTSLFPFNLGRLVLNGDSSQNLELQPGDVVTIFSKADIRVPQSEQTRLVRLEGEFISSGIYSVRPGETLRELVGRAGGLSPDAYLYGSDFTRESTRRMQQQRLNDYIDQMSLQASTSAAAVAGRNVSATDTAAGAALATQNTAIINSLRQARSTGRIVLDLRPDSNTVAQLPAIPLEDGDTFVVPHVPSTVSVAGAVYNPNAFLFDSNRRVGDYLKLAGGSNRDADAKRAYVVRADGAVLSKQQISSLRRSGFESLRVYPGDTIVVPLNLNRGAVMRNVVDIAQIFGQFGIAIAAASLVF